MANCNLANIYKMSTQNKEKGDTDREIWFKYFPP